MTRAEAIEWIYTIDTNYDLALREREALRMAIEALQGDMYCPNCGVRLVPENEYLEPTPTHGRLIDADALKENMKIAVVKHICTNTLYNTIMAVIDGSPTVQTDRPHGEWINREYCQVDEDAYEVATCSNCKSEITIEYPHDNYCPNCGAKMLREDD